MSAAGQPFDTVDEGAGVAERRAGALAELKRGLPLLLTAMVGCAVGMIGLSVYSLPFLSGSLAGEFGWQRTDVTTAASFLVAGLALTGPIAGRLCDRFGARRIILPSIVLYASGLLAISRFNGPLWLLYAGYFLLAVGGSGTTYAVYARVVSGWFDRARGLALGVMMSGPGISAAVLPFLLPPIVQQYSWRGGYVTLGLLSLAVILPAALLLRERPRTVAAAAKAEDGMTLREALRTRQFWAILVGVILVSSAIIGTHVNLPDLLARKGIDESVIVSAASIYGISIIVGRLAVGVALDRLHGTVVGGILFTFTAGAMLLFDFAEGWGAILVAAAALGVSSGAEGDLCAYIAGRYFGLKSFSEIFGWIYSALALGLAAGAAVAGALLSRTGSFDAWLLTGAAGSLVAAILFATLGRYREAPAGE